MITPTTCILALAVTLQTAQPKLNADTRNWIAENLCAAAEDRGVDVRLLGAYLLNENNAIDLYSIRPARCGNDHGLFQMNSCYQAHRKDLPNAHHPYYGAVLAADLLSENLKKFGWTWQAFAAYWSPNQAKLGTTKAKIYYDRFVRHYNIVDKNLQLARNWAEDGGKRKYMSSTSQKKADFVSHPNNKVIGASYSPEPITTERNQ